MDEALKNMSLIVIASAAALAIIYFVSFNFPAFINSSVCFGDKCFFVQIAETPAQREKGLMGVKHLDKDRGMLFVFEKEDVYPFWMKNTLIPLDIIWINKEKRIVFMQKNAQPCLPELVFCPYAVPAAKAKYVLEISGGASDALGIRIGDAVGMQDY